MNKILNVKEAISLAEKLKGDKKTIVICGGCFDILHIGHIRFLEHAKQKGDKLFVLLENDKNVKKIKGKNRPINSQIERAEVLEGLIFIDYIVMLDEMKTNRDYDNLIYSIKPNVIAITKNDPQKIHNVRQSKKINAKVIEVVNRIDNKSSSKLSHLIYKNF
ncbi:MAG TPA: adenylyltransferase/cytidyltransferase family protein [Candidatus Sulfotelmatobacter sp.]|nr:adenylyltransferase/cytidyltransferase family protein [Candidatus Sulfotelmatobacter sp.]